MAHVNPPYYTRGNIEVWDFIRDQELNYHLGNAIKYICRAGFKGDAEEDLSKALHYLENELSFRRSYRLQTSVWDPEQFGEPDHATGFDR